MYNLLVDIWSGKKRSFLGVTCYWISINNLTRISKDLACRHIKGSHTYEKISDLINKINSEFNLSPTKIVITITDYDSNFIKAFKMFGVKLKNIDIVEDVNLVDNNDDNSQSNLESNENYIFKNVVGHTIEIENILPVHFRCFAHTLNLCATADINKVIKDSVELSLIHQVI
jgi:hypothetical protein